MPVIHVSVQCGSLDMIRIIRSPKKNLQHNRPDISSRDILKTGFKHLISQLFSASEDGQMTGNVSEIVNSSKNRAKLAYYTL